MNFWIYVAGKFFILLLLLLVAFFSSVPYGLRAYERWLKTREPKYFSGVVIAASSSLLFIAFVGVSLISLIIRFDNLLSYGINRLVLSLVLVFFVANLSVPKALQFFRQWKQTKKPRYFSVSVFFCVLSIFALSIILAVFLPSAAT